MTRRGKVHTRAHRVELGSDYIMPGDRCHVPWRKHRGDSPKLCGAPAVGVLTWHRYARGTWEEVTRITCIDCARKWADYHQIVMPKIPQAVTS